MRLIKTISEIRRIKNELSNGGQKKVGFVPTMVLFVRPNP
jgi:pantothenate synthetase